MNWKSSLFIVSLLLFSCQNSSTGKTQEVEEVMAQKPDTHWDHIIEVEALMNRTSHPNVKIIDFRKEDQYQAGHIPGAFNITRKALEDDTYPYGGMKASESTIENLFSSIGISNSDTLVVYDQNGSCNAARFWWIMDSYGFENVQILNGGISAWEGSNGELTDSVPIFTPSTFSFEGKGSNDLLIAKDSLRFVQATRQELFIIDARSIDEYSGKRQKSGAVRAGRIPRSVLMDWSMAVNWEDHGKFRPTEELKEIYSELPKNKDRPIVVYCHSGFRSAHTTFVLSELLGYKDVRNYDGSWTEWSRVEQFPVEIDSTTTLFQ